MLSFLLRVFEWFWAKREILPYNPDVIVPLDYAMGQDRHISSMTVAGLYEAATYSVQFKDATVAYANSSHCFPGSEEVIAQEKWEYLSAIPWGYHPKETIDAGGIVNSVTEAFAVRDALEEKGIQPKEILVITGKQHSRSALYIWRKVFPLAEISLVYFRGLEWHPTHMFPSQRGGWVWAKANILRQAALRIMGLKWVAKQQHKPSQ